MKTNVNEKKKNTNNSFLTRSSNAPSFRISSMRSNRKAPVPLFSKNNNINSNNTNNIYNNNNNNEENNNNINVGQKTFTFNNGIIFTSEFNSGNMKECKQINDNEYSILIALDCEGKTLSNSISNYRIWFYFAVKSLKEKNIYITIENMNNFYKIFKNGYKIAYNELDIGVTPTQFQNSYTEGEENNWKRLDNEYNVSLDEKTNLLSIKFNYNLPEDRYVLFAFCFPWSYEKNEAYLKYIKDNYMNKINNDTNESIYYSDEILTLSKEKRNVHLLTISSKKNIDLTKNEQYLAGLFPYKNACNLPMHDKHIIFITARVHPGETPGTLIFNGILKTLINTDNPLNKILLDNFIFKLIPIINVDGVSNGYFRLDQDGFNLNRLYLNPNQKSNPENFAITKLFYFYSSKFKVRYYFDLHADMNARGVYTFGNALRSFEDHVENVLFSFIFKINCQHVDFSHCIFTERSMGTKSKNELAGKEATSRVQFYQRTGLIHTYTVESSYFKGIFNKDNMENENANIYMINDFEKTGNDLLKSILDYEEILLSDNLLRSDYQTIAKCRTHIAQIVKFNEERFRYNFSLRDFINNIEEQRKWMSIKQINEIREKCQMKRRKTANNEKIKNRIKKTISNNKLNRNKTMNSNNTKNVYIDFKINNNKTNSSSFRNNNDIFILPIKKKNPSVKDYHFHSIAFKGLNKKNNNYDILSHKPIKKLLEPIKNI